MKNKGYSSTLQELWKYRINSQLKLCIKNGSIFYQDQGRSWLATPLTKESNRIFDGKTNWTLSDRHQGIFIKNLELNVFESQKCCECRLNLYTMNPRKNFESDLPMRGLWLVKFYDILSQNYFKYDWVWSYDDSILTCSILSSIFNRLGSSDFGANRRKSRKWAITSAMVIVIENFLIRSHES